MLLPIVAYGSPVLHKKCVEVYPTYPDLDILLENMWETMYASSGVGIAAPQVNQSLRIFMVDTKPFIVEDSNEEAFKQVFINATIIEEKGKDWIFNEGCLSIPDVREDIKRKSTILIKYQDENFTWHENSFQGISARVIQHEYDHIEGILFIDKISSLRKRMIQSKLNNISKGNIDVSYKMHFLKSKF